jgi:chromosome segregation ATPase
VTIQERVKSEVISGDQQARRFQSLLNNSQDQFLRLKADVSNEKRVIEELLLELNGIDSESRRRLEEEETWQQEMEGETAEVTQLQDKMQKMTSDTIAKTREVEAIEDAVVVARTDLDCAVNALRIKLKQRDDLQSDLKNVTDHIADVDQQLVNMGSLYEEARSREITKKGQLLNLQTSLSNLQKERSDLISQVNETRSEIDTLTVELRNSQTTLSIRIQEQNLAKKSLRSENAVLEQLARVLDTRKDENQALERVLIQLEAKKLMAEGRLSVLIEGKCSVEKEIEETDKIMRDIETEMTEVMYAIGDRKNTILTNSAIIESCRSEIATLEIDLSAMESQISQLPSRLISIRDESFNLDARLMELGYQISMEKEKLKNGCGRIVSESEKVSLINQLKSLESQLEGGVCVRNKLQNQLSKHRSETRVYEKRCESYRSELEVIKQEVHEKETMATCFEHEEKTAEKSLIDRLVFRDKLMADLRDKKSELSSLISSVYESQKNLSELEEKLKKRNMDQTSRLEELRLVQKELESQRHCLRMELWQVQHSVDLMKSKLNGIARKEKEDDGPETVVATKMAEIEKLKELLEKTKKDCDKLEHAFDTHYDTTNAHRLEQLREERDRLISCVKKLPHKEIDDCLRKQIGAKSY